MTNDWLDDEATSFEDKIAQFEQLPEVGVRGPEQVFPFAVIGRQANNSMGSSVIPTLEHVESRGAESLVDSIARSAELTRA